MNLVIVESPTKAKTIQKYLGPDYSVMASGGHVCDLPERELGIDTDNDFRPKYVPSRDKAETIRSLKARAAECDEVYLATDPDREGEAISWHLSNVLKLNDAKRIEFHEISSNAVRRALERPRAINSHLVDAQQARRVLDRLVGYIISPIIGKKIGRGLSGGRVQSAALKMLVDREREIGKFVPEESWTVRAKLAKLGAESEFCATLRAKNSKKLKIADERSAAEIESALKDAAFSVSDVSRGVAKSAPPAPFITSTLQQEGSTALKISAPEVMRIAQQLYEGIDIAGLGQTALVTYIRTDSVRLSLEARQSARAVIAERFGPRYVPAEYNEFAPKGANVQDAHEAIRPISLDMTPESIKPSVGHRQYRLYKLIYDRFLASQMTPAEYDVVKAKISAKAADADYEFAIAGKTVRFDGHTVLCSHSKESDEEAERQKFPDLAPGDALRLIGLEKEQKFTKPPARYTEATFVRGMEENGIGRPATYANVIRVLANRKYTEKDGSALKPTALGIAVTEFMEHNFENIVDLRFTAQMETKLDEIVGGARWQEVLESFYPGFCAAAKRAEEDSTMFKPKDEASDAVCDKCGAPMVIKTGRYGKFLACSNYPQCKNTMNVDGGRGRKSPDGKTLEKAEDEITDVICDKCGAPMAVKTGRYGKFLGCTNYPKCKNIKTLDKPVAVCPRCGGDVHKLHSKRGATFYGCSNYPKCKFVSWDIPAPILCPKCGGPMRTEDKDGVVRYVCADKKCGHSVLPAAPKPE